MAKGVPGSCGGAPFCCLCVCVFANTGTERALAASADPDPTPLAGGSASKKNPEATVVGAREGDACLVVGVGEPQLVV